MTKLELKINGEPFEVELHGVQVTVDQRKLIIRAGSEETPTNSMEHRASIDFVAGDMIVVPIQ